MNRFLWVLQALLAALFLFAGGTKLAMPTDELARQAHMSGAFLKLIGVAEVAGALGLLLPGLTHIRPRLTPVAAAGLLVIMIGATTLAAGIALTAAILPGVVGLVTAGVAYARWRVAPLGERAGADQIR